jgi:hypothetical protein
MSSRKCIIAIVLLGGGCASQKTPVATAEPTTQPRYAVASAGALVFDPPVAIGQPPLQLSRNDRQPAAFAGYDASTTTYSYVRTEDRQTGDRHDRVERDAISEKVGVSYR